ncbi:MAG: glycosyltransferase family 39 protein [Chloroflexi bacterium]|nr:glycosyltransferase family 39 protein [Chloroflexota bacterium]
MSIVGFLAAGYVRITFAYPLSDMETPAMQAIRRILRGQPVYAQPSLDYVAPIYAPLFFYVSALVSGVVGVDLAAPRLVSMAAALGSATLVAHLIWVETRRRALAIVGAGLFISTTALSAFSLDLARVDPLCLCLLLGAIATARRALGATSRGLGWCVASGALTGLAVLTKQTAITLVVPLLLVALIDRRLRAAGAYLVGIAAATGVGVLVLTAQSGSWVEYFLVSLPRQHSLSLDQLSGFWTRSILPSAGLLLLFAGVFLVSRWLKCQYQLVRFWVLVSLGMLGLAWGATLNKWSDNNVLLPAFAVLVIVGLCGFDEVLRRLGNRTRDARVFRAFAFGLVAVEFLIVGYNPRNTAPLRSDGWALDRFVGRVAGLEGTVFAPDFPEVAVQAGKGDAAFGISTLELAGGFGGQPLAASGEWIADYRAALDRRQFAVLLLDPQDVEPFLSREAQASGYVDTGPLFPPDDVFNTWGSHYAPSAHVWLPAEQVDASIAVSGFVR